ncbi:hypothetical protein BHM03_00051932 [Ensete ventricosum]|nr:hypothetical protein BHM03_00051932 [Ensete ventricosum]
MLKRSGQHGFATPQRNEASAGGGEEGGRELADGSGAPVPCSRYSPTLHFPDGDTGVVRVAGRTRLVETRVRPRCRRARTPGRTRRGSSVGSHHRESLRSDPILTAVSGGTHSRVRPSCPVPYLPQGLTRMYEEEGLD